MKNPNQRKPKLTILQWSSLPFRWLIWICLNKTKRKSWPEVVSGIEKHEHKFVKYVFHGGRPFLMCGHYGCRECKPHLKSMVKGLPKSAAQIAFKKARRNDAWRKFTTVVRKKEMAK